MSLEAKVGVFVIVSLLVLGATVYSVRTTQDVRGQVVYTTYLRHAGGIAAGTPVLFAGIRVGQVASVRAVTRRPDPDRDHVRGQGRYSGERGVDRTSRQRDPHEQPDALPHRRQQQRPSPWPGRVGAIAGSGRRRLRLRPAWRRWPTARTT